MDDKTKPITHEEYRAKLVELVVTGTQRVESVKKLMDRNSASKWKPEKKAKMVRRLLGAEELVRQAQSMLDQLNVDIENKGR